MIIIAPSILSADFLNLKKDICWAEDNGAQWLHIDVMDGCFVPNITMGAPVLKSISGYSKLIMDVHLMIEEPEKHIEDFYNAGANIITVHAESSRHPDRLLNNIKEYGMKAGMALNPGTPLCVLDHLYGLLDLILIMSVNPGFSGQQFIPEMIPKIKKLADTVASLDNPPDIMVDGGINRETAPEVVNAGATALVMGSALYKKEGNDSETLNFVKNLKKSE